MNASSTTDTTDDRPRSTNRLRKLLVASAIAVIGCLGLTAGAANASVAPTTGNYGTNKCPSDRRIVDNLKGAQACYWLTVGAAHSSAKVSSAAYDYKRDGLSARNVMDVEQLIGGRWSKTDRVTTTASLGVGTSRVAGPYTILRAKGATQFRVRLYACNYDVPSGTYGTCVWGLGGQGAW